MRWTRDIARLIAVFIISFALHGCLGSGALSARSGNPSGGELREIHPRILLRAGPWEQAEVEALTQAAAELPQTLVDAIARAGGPLVLERRRRGCAYGIGRDEGRCPRFDPTGRVFYVYDFVDPGTASAEPGLAELDQAALLALWRRRALIHAVVARGDLAHGWSEEPAFRVVNGWEDDDEALNRHPAAYSRALGRRSAHLDLVTTAEAYFAPARPFDPAHPDDDALRCRAFTRARFVATRLGGQRAAAFDATTRCPRIDAWARTEGVESVDVLMAAATGDRPQSLFGHLLLHVRYGGEVHSRGFDPVYQFGAVTDSDVDAVDYVTTGVFGGFTSVLTLQSFRHMERTVRGVEQRTLRRYTLNLTPSQVRRMMHRIWEAQRSMELTYAFFSDNCASLLLYLIAPVVDGRYGLGNDGVVMPADVLDVLAAQRGPHGRPLLERSPEILLGRRDLARRGVDTRVAALRSFTLAAGVDASQRSALQALDEALGSAQPTQRARAYRAIAPRLSDALAAIDDPERRARAFDHAVDYTRACVGFERHLLEALDTRWLLRRAREVSRGEPTTAREVLARRERIMADPDPVARQEQLNAWASEASDRLWEGEEGRDGPAVARLDEAREVQRSTLLAALATQAELLDLRPDFDARAFLDAREQAERDEVAARDARALGAAGRHRLVAGAQVRRDLRDLRDQEGWSPRLTLGYHYVFQRLGEVRRRGYRPDIEMEALGLRLGLLTDDAIFALPRAELVVLRYLTLEQRLGPLRRSWSDAFGWAFGLRAERDLDRGIDIGGRGELGYTLPVARSDDGVDYLMLAGLADLAARAGGAGGVLLGPRLVSRAQLHLGGAYVNVLRASAHAVPYVGLDDGALRVESELRLELALALLGSASTPLVATPYAAMGADWAAFEGAGVDQRWTLGLSLEMP